VATFHVAPNVGVEHLATHQWVASVFERLVGREKRREHAKPHLLPSTEKLGDQTSGYPEVFFGRVYERSRYTSALKTLRSIPYFSRFMNPHASCYVEALTA
jgi:hypothetical protein